jgi:hypothetical protein
MTAREECVDLIAEKVRMLTGWRGFLSTAQCRRLASVLRKVADEIEDDVLLN